MSEVQMPNPAAKRPRKEEGKGETGEILVFHKTDGDIITLCRLNTEFLFAKSAKDREMLENLIQGTSHIEKKLGREPLMLVLPEEHFNFQGLFDSIPKGEVEAEKFYALLFEELPKNTPPVSVRIIIQTSYDR